MNSQTLMRTKPVILVFGRYFLIDSFKSTFGAVADAFDVEYLTDGTHAGTSDTRRDFYAALKAGTRSTEVSPAVEADVIRRCRALRNLDQARASSLVHAMAQALAATLDRVRPAAIASQMVDEYSTHLLSVLAAQRGIGYFGYCAGYFPGVSLLLADAHGRPFEWRDADDAEIDATLAEVSQRAFRQLYNLGASYGLARHLRQMARYRVKRVVFALRGWRERDPWNIHYVMTPFIAERRWARDYPKRAFFEADWQAAIARLRVERPDARVLYMPLGFFPEATIDYWIGNTRAIDYEAFVLEVVRTLAKKDIVVVKEHLHMMGSRSGEFLRALGEIPGAVSVHPLELSNAVVERADAVLLGTGSPGIEAAIRGKPVFSFSDTSYWFRAVGAIFLDLDAIDRWPAHIRETLATFTAPDAPKLREMIRDCLRSSTRVRPGTASWPQLDPDDLKLLLGRVIERAKTCV